MMREHLENQSGLGGSGGTTFDFDQWAALAVADPVAFEARRLAMIEAIIQNSPSHVQHRLRGLQFRIDMERRRSKTPLAACMRISEMMWDTVLGEKGLKASLESVAGLLLGQPVDGREKPQRPARVLPFQKATLLHGSAPAQ